MNFFFYTFILAVAVLLFLLAWSLRAPKKRRAPSLDPVWSLQDPGRRHATYLPQIQRALAPAGFEFLTSRAWRRLTRRVGKERRRLALTYFSRGKEDFHSVLKLGRVNAA